jgi:hypothetical protein
MLFPECVAKGEGSSFYFEGSSLNRSLANDFFVRQFGYGMPWSGVGSTSNKYDIGILCKMEKTSGAFMGHISPTNFVGNTLTLQ